MTRIDAPEVPRQGLWAAVAIGALLSIVVSARLAAGRLALGSVKAGWVYTYLYDFQPRSLAIFAIVCACCAVPAMASLEAARRHEWRVVMAWFALGLLAQAVLRGLTNHTMEALFLADGSFGFYQATEQYRVLEFLRNFERIRPSLGLHPATNMPGKVAFVFALELLSSKPVVLTWLVVIASDLGGIFLYLFVRDYFRDRDAALLAFVFYLFVPAKLLLFPVLNTVSPVFALACAWLWMRLLETQKMAYAAALGAVAYLLLFFDPTPAVMGLLFVCLTAYAVRRGEVTGRTVIVSSAVVISSFLITYAIFRLVFGFNLFVTLRTIANHAVEFNARVKRPYGPWVGQNLLDLAFGAGICQIVLFCVCVVIATLELAGGRHDNGRLAMFCVGTAATIAVTDLAGINRGEVVRLWIYLACFAQVPAAWVCARLARPGAALLVIGTSLLQIAIATSMVAFAQP